MKGGETMAILSKNDFMSKIKEIIGEDTSDNALAFVEDMTDTYNDLEGKKSDDTDWKSMYEENDKKWREKYRARFFDYSAEADPLPQPQVADKTEEEIRAETITVKDIFTAEKE